MAKRLSKLSYKRRKIRILARIAGGDKINALARRYHVSKTCIHNWLQQNKISGLPQSHQQKQLGSSVSTLTSAPLISSPTPTPTPTPAPTAVPDNLPKFIEVAIEPTKLPLSITAKSNNDNDDHDNTDNRGNTENTERNERAKITYRTLNIKKVSLSFDHFSLLLRGDISNTKLISILKTLELGGEA